MSQKAKQPLPSTLEEKIGAAEGFKEEGNAAFQAGNMKEAKRCYNKVFLYINGLPSSDDQLNMYSTALSQANMNDEQEARVLQLRISCNCNLAAVYLNLKSDMHQAIKHCDRVLEASPEHVKSLYRKAQALMNLKQYEDARKLLLKAAKLDPKSKPIRSSLKEVNKKLKDGLEEQRKAMAAAFNSY